MYIFNLTLYTLIMSYNPCDIFKYYNVTELHGLHASDCELYNNTTEDAYIAGWCNIAPTDGKPFIFINLSRCTDDIHTTGLVMHETTHLAFTLQYIFDIQDATEEGITTFAEKEAYRIVDLIKQEDLLKY